jgi:hypothetical protein
VVGRIAGGPLHGELPNLAASPLAVKRDPLDTTL